MKLKEAPDCPYCGERMKKCMTPPFAFADGLGWGVPYIYICMNDECKLFRGGWEHIKENYGKVASYRCMFYPDNGKMDTICVFSPDAYKGQIVEE